MRTSRYSPLGTLAVTCFLFSLLLFPGVLFSGVGGELAGGAWAAAPQAAVVPAGADAAATNAAPAANAAPAPAVEAPAGKAPAGKSTGENSAEGKPSTGKSPEENGKSTDPERPRFIRIRRDEQDRPLALETAVVRFSNPRGDQPDVRVDLVGVVHVGDQAYFEQLNKRFAEYDAVLYELVADEGRNVPRPGQAGKSAHPVGVLQMGMKNMLELEFQLDHIDYTRPNMVHADMSPSEFSRTMQDRGESFLELFFRMMGQGMAQQAQNTQGAGDLQILGALFSKDRAAKLKRLMAAQFEAMDGSMPALDGPDGSTIVTERNKKALEVLAEQIKAGKKRIAVFYGAGHLPDMQRRLEADFKLHRTGEQWVAAWALSDE